ncbi:MAG: prohibitin family protein [Cyanothece sp. SIO2G6]|nr:prohibitin family protein [Cyanothece sp. SIO2G6]
MENRIRFWFKLLSKISPLVITLVSLMIIVTNLNPFRFVNNGENLVVFSWFGGVQPQPLEPGFHFVMPLITDTHAFDIRTQTLTWKDGDPNAYGPRLISLSQDGQEIRSEVTLQFNVADAPTLLQTLGSDYIDWIAPIVRSAISSETAAFSAQDLYSTQRPALQAQIRERVATDLQSYGILVVDFLLRDVTFDADFVAALEAKTIAENTLIQKQFEIEQARQTARSIVSQAEAEAGSLQAKADAITANPQYLDLIESQVLGETLDVLVTVESQSPDETLDIRITQD